MKSPTAWIIIAFLLIAVITALVLMFGAVGVLLSIVVGATFFVGLFMIHQQRTKRLVQSINPDEILVANGIVSESTYDETPAILARALGSRYRVLVADSRGSQAVRSVNPALTSHSNPYDLKRYLEINTDQGVVHFAPRNSVTVVKQPEYAQEVSKEMLANGIPPKGS